MSPQLGSELELAKESRDPAIGALVTAWLSEYSRSDAASAHLETLQALLKSQEKIIEVLVQIVNALRVASDDFADAVRELQRRAVPEAPQVSVEAPDVTVDIGAPVLNPQIDVQVPPASVTVGPPQLPSRIVKTVIRDNEGRITSVVEEWS